MIDCTYQDGLTITLSMVAVVSRVGVRGLPATMLVRQTTRWSRTTLSVKSVIFDHHVSVAEVARQPAPALYIGFNAVDRLAHARRLFGPLMSAMVLLSTMPIA